MVEDGETIEGKVEVDGVGGWEGALAEVTLAEVPAFEEVTVRVTKVGECEVGMGGLGGEIGGAEFEAIALVSKGVGEFIDVAI